MAHTRQKDAHAVALVLIDVINALDFPEAKALLPRALAAALVLKDLKARAKRARVPCIYVNDNFGQWRSDFRQVVAACGKKGSRGAPLVRMLKPGPADYFVLKPMHSGFFGTALELLLRRLKARTLVLGGLAGDICVLFTANDAYLRDFRLVVPSDGIASETEEGNARALATMERLLKAKVAPAAKLSFGRAGVHLGR